MDMLSEQCQQQCLERPASGFWQALGRLIQHAGRRLERWDQAARQRQQLLAMDEHQLKDIGISRADAERLAGRGSFRKDR